jgi:hypothetical protein
MELRNLHGSAATFNIVAYENAAMEETCTTYRIFVAEYFESIHFEYQT